MSDNTQVNTGSGDSARTIDRSLNPVAISAKTQVIQLDAGGQSGEALVSGANPLPVLDPYNRLVATLNYHKLLALQAGTNGFIPYEVPSFLVGQ